MRFEFPFNLIGKSTMSCPTTSVAYSDPGTQMGWGGGGGEGAENKDFGAVLQTDQKFSVVFGAGYRFLRQNKIDALLASHIYSATFIDCLT